MRKSKRVVTLVESVPGGPSMNSAVTGIEKSLVNDKTATACRRWTNPATALNARSRLVIWGVIVCIAIVF
jgi:hypothetical protein